MAIDFSQMGLEDIAFAKAQLHSIIGRQRIVYAEPAKPRRSKYNAMRTEYNGIVYDSKSEAKHAEGLDAQILVGEVAWWLRQVPIQLGPDFKNRVDFLVAMKGVCPGPYFSIHAEEVKGVRTRDFSKVIELWPKYAPINLWIYEDGLLHVIRGKD